MTTEILTVKGDNGVEFPCTRAHYEIYQNDLTIVAEVPEKIEAPPVKKSLPAPKAKAKAKRKPVKKVVKDKE